MGNYDKYIKDNPRQYRLALNRSTKWKRKKQEEKAGRCRPERCEICNRLPEGKALHFDHDHETAKFRGWICHRCNTAIGLCQDDPLWLEALASYLRDRGKI